MSELHAIYWIQGLGGGVWQNLQRCDDHNDAIARMGPLLTDERYDELRLVLAQSQDGHIDYTTLVTTRDGKVISDAPLVAGLPPTPSAPPPLATSNPKRRLAVLGAMLAAAVTGGLVIATYDRQLAVAFYERAASLTRMAPQADSPQKKVADPPQKKVADPPQKKVADPPQKKVADPPQKKVADPPQTQNPDPPEKPAPARLTPNTLNYPGQLFAAVDANDAAAMWRLMAVRPDDILLDELADFVDDGWGTGPRMIVDYALLGGHLAAAQALLAAGVTPSDWLRGIVASNMRRPRLQPAIALLMKFGALPEISVAPAIQETDAKRSGN
jgi:hypothetical protein